MSTLDNLRKAARRWHKSLLAGEPGARDRLRRVFPGAPSRPTLRDVQHALARERGFENWIALTRSAAQNRTAATHLGASLLHEAAERGDLALARQRLAEGADLSVMDALGLTPLDRAALAGHDPVVQALLDAGAALTLPAAIALDRQADVERLVAADPDALAMTSRDRWARLVVHASGRAPGPVLDRVLHTLTRYRAGLSVVNVAAEVALGYTALHNAARHGNDDAVRVLLDRGANPRSRDPERGMTPARWAAEAGHPATAARLLDGDIDIFDAIDFDRADRVGDILDRDPGALERPFDADGSGLPGGHRASPTAGTTPREWAAARDTPHARRLLEARGGSRTTELIDRTAALADFLESACWDGTVHGRADHRLHDHAAGRLLGRNPWLATASLHAAIVCGELQEVVRVLTADPAAARRRGGPRDWTPILYLAYTRFTNPATIDQALPIARLLLDAGADPNDFYMAGDARYSALVGVAAEGEQDAPRQPYASGLAALLLARGAEPFDVQILYNTHFSGDMEWWLELVYRHTATGPGASAWRDPDWSMFDMGAYGSGARFVLETAIKTRRLSLAEWALDHGATPNAASARDTRFPKRSLYELALTEHLPEMAELLARHGAVRSTPVLQGLERFVAACLAVDSAEATRLLGSSPELRAAPQPVFEAARRNRPDALALLHALGWSMDVRDFTGKRPLHEAALHSALEAARFLVAHGAEVDAREHTYNGTPLSWASHGDRAATIDFLAARSRHLAALAARGYTDRVRAVLAEDPAPARAAARDGSTPLFWLPDDEPAALQIIDMLLEAGADPSATNASGCTAADRARRRGLDEAAERLEQAAGRAP